MDTRERDLYEDGLALFQEDRLGDAVRKMRRAIEIDPSLEDAHEALGVLLGRDGQIDEAIAATRVLVALNPNHLMAHVNLSIFYNKKGGMIEEAEEEQARARVLGWKEELSQKVSAAPSLAPQARQGPRPERDTFLEVLKLDPDDAVANFSVGGFYLDEGEYEKAREHLATVVRVQGDYSAAYLLLGQAHEALGDPKAAALTYRAGIAAAQARGDLKPLQAMEKRLAALASEGQNDNTILSKIDRTEGE